MGRARLTVVPKKSAGAVRLQPLRLAFLKLAFRLTSALPTGWIAAPGSFCPRLNPPPCAEHDGHRHPTRQSGMVAKIRWQSRRPESTSPPYRGLVRIGFEKRPRQNLPASKTWPGAI